LNTKLHAVCDQDGRPVALPITEGQVSDYKGASVLIDKIPHARHLLADRGYVMPIGLSML
jgi:transposase